MNDKVKELDDKSPPLLDHVGWQLWRASQVWQGQFKARMVASGHAWFAEARSAVIPHVSRNGTRQQELSARLGMTKQAVQQLVDLLVDDGVVERRPDPRDARGRLVCFTPEGLRVLADANLVKRQIEAEYERLLGVEAVAGLKKMLATLAETGADPA